MRLTLLATLLLTLAVPVAARADESSLTPSDIQRIYGLPKTGAADQMIGIVSAFDDPHAEADLAAYTKHFKIPSCTSANDCFRKLNQAGKSSPLPQVDPTGGVFLTESSVGTELARGLCQSCSVVLVEAGSSSKYDLTQAANTAAAAGATVVVTTNNQGEAPDDNQYLADYGHPHTIDVAASGDTAYTGTAYFPATLPNVLAVGGTAVDLNANGSLKDEIGWPNTTSGCSLYQAAPNWQASLAASVGCGGKRAVTDLSAVAEPGPFVHIQDLGSPCGSSFCEADGTSVSAPIIAAMIGLAGSAGQAEPARVYAHARSEPLAVRDITSGATDTVCAKRAICQPRKGYDGATGLGAPNGLALFLANGGALDSHHPHVSVRPGSSSWRVGRGGTVAVRLQNGNPFAVRGSLSVTATRLGRRQSVGFGSLNVSTGSLGSQTLTLHLSRTAQKDVAAWGRSRVTAVLRVAGAAGRSVRYTVAVGTLR